MLHNMRRTAAGLFAAALAIAALASASSTHKISAALNAKQEVPKQVVKVPGAMGSFSGSIEGGKQATLRWKLTFLGGLISCEVVPL